MGDILIEFRKVERCCLDLGFSLLRVDFTEWQPATQPGKETNGFWVNCGPGWNSKDSSKITSDEKKGLEVMQRDTIINHISH